MEDSKTTRRPLISIVIPAMNEGPNVDAAVERVDAVFAELAERYDYEIVFTDNHSSDDTFERIACIAAENHHVRGLRFSRNFGFQRSILEGYRAARGAAAIQLDCDLQDPPELIERFLDLWEQGNRVVYGVRVQRAERGPITLGRRLFYRLVNLLSEDDLPLDAGDFRLIDRCVLDALKRLDDAQPYLRGAIAAMGFQQAAVPYTRAGRTSGESKFGMRQLLALSVDGILNHSTVPLRIATVTGLVISFVTVLGIVGYLLARFAFGQSWPAGFATTTTLLLLGISLNALFLGIIGEYLGRIYKQVKRGPNTLIEAVVEDGVLRTDCPVVREA